PQLITLLLEFGADPKILNSQGLTPIQTAIELNLYDCALTYGKARLKQEELDLMLFRLCNHFNYVCGRTPHKFIQQVLVMGANPNCNPTLLSNDNCWKFGDGIILSFLDHGINIENKNFSDNYGRRVFQNLVNRTRFDAAAACLLLARNTELPVEVIDRIGRYLYHHSVFNPKTGSQSESIAKKIKLKSVSESKSENKDKNPKCTLM
ncbi:MAG TPA: hypothetical protein VLG12_06745, partial [Candidatus Saccharimonadales bacterium]|nr:hypothetical protein [Candidatus Saccharimonadales bacterium]